MDEVKPGWKTTEFWKSALIAVAGLIMASGAIPSSGVWGQVAGMVSAALASAGYAASRGAAKA